MVRNEDNIYFTVCDAFTDEEIKDPVTLPRMKMKLISSSVTPSQMKKREFIGCTYT